MPKRKPKSVAKLKKDLWKVFSRYIRIRDALETTGYISDAKCVTCFRVYPVTAMDAGHFLSRRHTSILFDETNVSAQCVGCNYGGGEQYLYSKRIVEKYGQEGLERLLRMKEETKKYTPKELTGLIVEYKSKVKELTDRHGSPWSD